MTGFHQRRSQCAVQCSVWPYNVWSRDDDLECVCVCVQAVQGKKEHLYKILVIGDLGTGKTSIVKRYTHQFFLSHYRATVSTDYIVLWTGDN